VSGPTASDGAMFEKSARATANHEAREAAILLLVDLRVGEVGSLLRSLSCNL
jgi:hypothetical protein